MGKSTGMGKMTQKVGNDLGQKIGAGYAEQGKSWGEIASMPSSGDGMMRDTISSGVKTGYDNYMANNKPASESTSSANMLQSSGGSGPMMGSAAISRGVKAGYDILMGNYKPASESTPSAKMIQSPGGSAGGLAASALGTSYDSQSNAQSMNVSPMINNSIGSLGQNNTGGMGLSSGLASSGINQPWSPYGVPNGVPNGTNEYNIIDGVKLV